MTWSAIDTHLYKKTQIIRGKSIQGYRALKIKDLTTQTYCVFIESFQECWKARRYDLMPVNWGNCAASLDFSWPPGIDRATL